ncbi:hypothetical protein EMIT093MI4_30227 [Pseudomonas sp. IT-93MI4]
MQNRTCPLVAALHNLKLNNKANLTTAL